MKQPLAETIIEGAQSTMQSHSVEEQQLPEVRAEETPPSNLKKLVRRLTTKMRPPKVREASLTVEHESAEDKLAGFMSRNPALFVPTQEESKRPHLDIVEPVARVRQLSKSQRELERLENPLILDPTPIEEVEEQQKAEETMRQSRAARFRRRLEEYF